MNYEHQPGTIRFWDSAEQHDESSRNSGDILKVNRMKIDGSLPAVSSDFHSSPVIILFEVAYDVAKF